MAIESRWPTTPGWNKEHFQYEIASEGSLLFVIESEGTLVGYAGYLRVPPEAQITTLAVAPENTGHGLGKRLITHLIEVARSEGLTLITLEVSAENPAALKLYRGAGFKVVGRRAKFYNDASDALLMDLRLT